MSWFKKKEDDLTWMGRKPKKPVYIQPREKIKKSVSDTNTQSSVETKKT